MLLPEVRYSKVRDDAIALEIISQYLAWQTCQQRLYQPSQA